MVLAIYAPLQCIGICAVCESLNSNMRRQYGTVKDQRQERQRSFSCSEAGGNNGLLDQRA